MARTAALGHQDFKQLITGNIFYVDKTPFIKEWWENGDVVTLITRPRRFGKTLNMSMLEYFFSAEYTGQGALFEGLSIWKEEKYRRLQGTYPVISLSFAGVKPGDYSSALLCISQLLTELYHKNDFLLQGDVLSDSEKEEYKKITMDMPEAAAQMAVHKMAGYLSRYYSKKAIILLDEYDTPLQEAWMYGYWEDMARFMGGLFNFTFKANPYLDRAVMTGITRVSKESIFSDLNNLAVATATSDLYASSFGFTEEEVYAALQEYGLEKNMLQVKQWYDGFVFGSHRDIYNPWSVLGYLRNRKLAAYWANTSSNGLVSKLIREGSRDVKLVMEELLNGGIFCTQLDEQIVFGQLDTCENAIWSLLLAGGYLRVEGLSQNEWGEDEYSLALTNGEVRLLFRQLIAGWFAGSRAAYNDFIKALLAGDVDAMNIYMNRVALAVFSYFDTGTQPSEAEPERFYHGFVLGLMVELAGKYVILSNRESGFGRYDVMLEPLCQADDAYILEFKVRSPEKEKNLQETVQNALAQIREKRYAASLEQKGILPEKIHAYGFAFEGKKVWIDGEEGGRR